jgi:hypothetical protein
MISVSMTMPRRFLTLVEGYCCYLSVDVAIGVSQLQSDYRCRYQSIAVTIGVLVLWSEGCRLVESIAVMCNDQRSAVSVGRVML